MQDNDKQKQEQQNEIQQQNNNDSEANTDLPATGFSNQGSTDTFDYTVKKEDVHADKGKYDITEETGMDE